tara:strand:- start:1374 stop:2123 length:750 start_codon:yes stop_codon:yes gene_type:complete
MIEIKNIFKSFGKSEVLHDISAKFDRGKTNLIIGQSGSGKTVLLKCLLGLYPINKGELIYDNVYSSKMNDEEKINIKKEMGMVFQGSALFDSLTVLENVRFPLDMLTKYSDKKKNEIALKFIDRVNLNDAINKLPSEISGGMQKRVGIARAIVLNPKYLFCDEPNSGLDPKTAIVIDNLIQEITKEYNITTVINSHDMNSVIEIGENIIFLKEGIKLWQGNNKEILASKNIEVEDFVYSSELVKKLKKN